MIKKNVMIIAVILMLTLSLMAGVAFATSGGASGHAEGGEATAAAEHGDAGGSGHGEAAGHGEGHASVWGKLVYQLINFAVLVGILTFAAKKADLKGMINGRAETIRKSIEEARAAKEAAEKALTEVEEKLKTKDREISELSERAEQSGQKERERLIAEGERLSKAIVEQARMNIEIELRQAKAALKQEAVELALELAEKKIGQKLTDGDQKALFEDALKRLEDKS